MNQMLEQVQKMQADMMAAQEALKDEEVEASAGGGMVKVVDHRRPRRQDVTIDPEAVDPEDVEMLQDMVPPRSTRRCAQAQELAASKMGGVAGAASAARAASAGSAAWLGGMSAVCHARARSSA